MICTDQRIVDICTELFRFLKSDLTESIIHTKSVKKINKRSVIQTEITIGFISIRMVWKPYQLIDNKEIGSDEGANLFLYLAFRETSSVDSDQLMITGYYSERGTNKVVTIQAPNEFKSTTFGPKRIVKNLEVDNTNPI